jgi:hypothetical protein
MLLENLIGFRVGLLSALHYYEARQLGECVQHFVVCWPLT